MLKVGRHLTRPFRLAASLVLALLAVAAVAIAAERPASAQTPPPTVSVTCPAEVAAVANGADGAGSADCTFTASALPDGPITVRYQVIGAGHRSIEYRTAVRVAATPATGAVYFLRDTTAVTVRILPGDGYTLGTPNEATISVGPTFTTGTEFGLQVNEAAAAGGYTLLTGTFHEQFYLIDDQGREAFRWDGNASLAKLLGTGRLLVGHTGGYIREISPDGSAAYDLSTEDLQHHDVLKLSNGNYLYINSAFYSRDDSIAAGANPACVGEHGLEVDEVLEIQPSGTDGATVVWRWRAWDHLIQDFDSTKANYGVVADHPERIDLNYNLCWLHNVTSFVSNPHHVTHLNSLDYNAELDQILITSRHFSEAWIIDHSVTTEQAAGSTGGKSGMGGDLLYRWGNPRVDRSGTRAGQELFFPHNAHWIADGLPGEGNVLVYNNGWEQPGQMFGTATVDEIVLPATGHKYLRAAGSYVPPTSVWSYRLAQPTWIMSNAQRLPNGNTVFTEGNFGRISEVTPEGEVVWHFVSPLARGIKVLTGETTASNNVNQNWIYRTYRYPADHPGIQALSLVSESERRPLVQSACDADPTSETLITLVRGYHDTNKNRAGYDQSWLRVLIAFGAETSDTLGPFTVDEAKEAEKTWNGWTPVLEELERLPCVPVSPPRPPVTVPSVTISGGSAVTEGTAASFTVTASPAPSSALTVNVSVSSVGGFASAATRTVTIPTSGSATLSVATAGDSVDEPDGSVTVTVTTGTGYTVGSTSAATVTVRDDDVPSVTVSGGSAVTEGSAASFTVTASPAPSSALTVNVSVSSVGGFASAATRTVTVPTSGSATLSVATTGDSVDEPDGSVTVTVTTGTGYTVGSTSAATVTVRDDDATVPSVSVSGGGAVTEGSAASFTVTASPAPSSALTVNVSVSSVGGFASAATRTVTIPTSGSATVSVATTGDSIDEPDGSVTATVTAGTGYTVGSARAATVTVRDDDGAAVPSVTVSAGSAVTEGSAASFTVTASPAPSSALTVNVSVSSVGGFASAATRTVTVPTSGSATVSVATTGDSVDEPDGSVTVTVTAGTGYTVGSTSAATVTVRDDDATEPPDGPLADVSFVAPSGGTSASLNGRGSLLANQVYLKAGEQAVPLRLPGACGTTGATTYRLEGYFSSSRALPDGLVFDAATRTISSMPTKYSSVWLRLVVTDSGGTANGRVNTAAFVFRLINRDPAPANTSVDCTSGAARAISYNDPPATVNAGNPPDQVTVARTPVEGGHVPRLKPGTIRTLFAPNTAAAGSPANKYVNDHTVYRDAGGKWHVLGVSDDEQSGTDGEFQFAHGRADSLLGPYTRRPDIDPSGPTTWAFAPHAVTLNGQAYMFYGPKLGGLVTSSDMSTWTNRTLTITYPAGTKITESTTPRDQMIFKDGDTYYMYITSLDPAADDQNVVDVLKSTDLIRWAYVGHALTLSGDAVQASWSTAESPFVVKYGDLYYLFVTVTDTNEDNDNYHQTLVFKSDSPTDFGDFNGEKVGPGGAQLVAELPVHAPEVVQDPATGKWYITTAGWDPLQRYSQAADGVAIIEMEWVAAPANETPISNARWTVRSVSSQDGDHPGSHAIDRDPTTYWESGSGGTHTLDVNLGAVYDVNGFVYVPEPHGDEGGIDGVVTSYRLYVSADGTNWGDPVASGTFDNSIIVNNGRKLVTFSTKRGQYIRFVSAAAAGGSVSRVQDLGVLGSAV
ncbi:discoidin domain-containing protein [Candidatus Poriferisodalis sp.]|uniref:discoidin domain-containing protein n=1 Tax=Candidatus Poriferisodalis sp. TaxID=3101277 RepID=UPI003B0123A2